MKKTEAQPRPVRSFFELPRHIHNNLLDWRKARTNRKLLENRAVELEFENLHLTNQLLRLQLKRVRHSVKLYERIHKKKNEGRVV